MPPTSEAVPVTIWAPTLGLYSDTSNTLIPDRACSACSNVIGYEGKLRPRPGFTATLSTLGANLSAYHFSRNESLAGTLTRFALSYNTGTNAVKIWERVGAAWTDRTGAAVLTGSETIHPTSCNFKGTTYFTTGNDILQYWTVGANTADVTNGTAALLPFPDPRIVLAWDSRLWNFNTEDGSGNRIPYRAAWSDYLLDNVWRGGTGGGSSGFQDLVDGSTDDTEPILAAMDTLDTLYAFKANTIYAISNVGYPKYYEGRKVVRGIGCVSMGTLRRFREALIFLGDDNVYLMENGQQPRPIADRIRTRLKAVVATANLERSVGIVDRQNLLYYLFLPKVSTTTMITLFIFSFRDGGTWWEGEIAGTDILPVCAYAYRESPFNDTLTIGSRDTKFYIIDSTAVADAGTAFTASWTSKWWDALQIGGGQTRNEALRIQKVAIHAQSGNVTPKIRTAPNIDAFETQETLPTVELGATGDRYVSLRKTNRFTELNLTFDMTSTSTRADVEGLTLHVLPRDGNR